MANTSMRARSLQELGLAAWFGGSLMTAVGAAPAEARIERENEQALMGGAARSRWAPVNLAAIAAYLAGSLVVMLGNKGRLVSQHRVATTSAVKTAIIVAAVGATAYARVVGQRVIGSGDAPTARGTEPADGARPEVAAARRRLQALQWTVPALTGALIVFNAVMGEMQRPSQVASGVLQRVLPNRPSRRQRAP